MFIQRYFGEDGSTKFINKRISNTGCRRYVYVLFTLQQAGKIQVANCVFTFCNQQKKKG